MPQIGFIPNIQQDYLKLSPEPFTPKSRVIWIDQMLYSPKTNMDDLEHCPYFSVKTDGNLTVSRQLDGYFQFNMPSTQSGGILGFCTKQQVVPATQAEINQEPFDTLKLIAKFKMSSLLSLFKFGLFDVTSLTAMHDAGFMGIRVTAGTDPQIALNIRELNSNLEYRDLVSWADNDIVEATIEWNLNGNGSIEINNNTNGESAVNTFSFPTSLIQGMFLGARREAQNVSIRLKEVMLQWL